MKKFIFLKILTGSVLVFLSLHFVVYFYYYKRGIENTVIAATYMTSLNAMRELSFIDKGIKNKNIKQGCFIHQRINEVLTDIDSCFNKNYPKCRNYGLKIAPEYYIDNYTQIKANSSTFSGCNE